jgi:hypothetical protein
MAKGFAIVKSFGKLLQFLKWLNTEAPHEPAIPLLGIYPGNVNTHITQKKTCTHMFIAALFIMTKKMENSSVHQQDKG